MRCKRAITPVIAVILLIVMTVGIAAFTFVWMQNFVQSLQTQTQQQAQQLQRPQFTITYAAYDKANKKISFVLSNIGSVPIKIDELKVTIEEYKKEDGSFQGAIVVNEQPKCNPSGTLQPNKDTKCEIDRELKTEDNYYLIIVSYRGSTAQYTLRR